jgi:hypothetical protein
MTAGLDPSVNEYYAMQGHKVFDCAIGAIAPKEFCLKPRPFRPDRDRVEARIASQAAKHRVRSLRMRHRQARSK